MVKTSTIAILITLKESSQVSCGYHDSISCDWLVIVDWCLPANFDVQIAYRCNYGKWLLRSHRSQRRELLTVLACPVDIYSPDSEVVVCVRIQSRHNQVCSSTVTHSYPYKLILLLKLVGYYRGVAGLLTF
jgi:hypothetical protein